MIGSLVGTVRKTKAEYQREYRERKKLQGDSFMQKERERKRVSYISSQDLTKRDLQRRRKINREKVQRYREKKKQERAENEKRNANKRKSSRKRISRAISRANNKIKNLEDKVEKSERKIWKLQKKLQRLIKVKALAETSNVKNTPVLSVPSTPVSKAETVMKNSGLDPHKYRTIRRKLIFHNSLVDEIKSVEPIYTKRIVSGKVMKKYRMFAEASRSVAIRRHSLHGTTKSMIISRRERNKEYKNRLQKSVQQFLERGDNSTIMPGKNDYKTTNKQQNQKRILSDHLKNLYVKYKSEESNFNLSYTTFCRLRPSHFSLVSYSTRSTCLCSKHQNMALKLRCLQKLKAVHTDNPEEFIKNIPDDVSQIFPPNQSNFEFEEWSRVKSDSGQRVICLTKQMDRQSFINHFKQELKNFQAHSERVKLQYSALNKLKKELPADHVIVQMDFAENFNCKYAEEVQSSYFNKSMVTLHPVVVYYKKDNALCHKNFTFISDDLSHNSATVFGVIKKLVPAIQTINQSTQSISCIHYWTDSPTSQYRNKTIFSLVAHHKSHFGIDATWDYFEAGHGKGPCDGIDGTVKRSADIAIKQKKVLIQSPDDFYEWACSSNLAVTFKYISKVEIGRYSIILDMMALNVKPVRGTLKLHAVRSLSTKTLTVRETSCYCPDCIASPLCHGWQSVQL